MIFFTNHSFNAFKNNFKFPLIFKSLTKNKIRIKNWEKTIKKMIIKTIKKTIIKN